MGIPERIYIYHLELNWMNWTEHNPILDPGRVTRIMFRYKRIIECTFKTTDITNFGTIQKHLRSWIFTNTRNSKFIRARCLYIPHALKHQVSPKRHRRWRSFLHARMCTTFILISSGASCRQGKTVCLGKHQSFLRVRHLCFKSLYFFSFGFVCFCVYYITRQIKTQKH